MQKGLYEGGGAYTWSNTSGEEKVGLSAGRPIRGGEGLIGRGIQYLSFPKISKGSNTSRVISICNSVTFIGTLHMTY